MRVNLREQILNLVALVFFQLPLLYKITLFDKAFGFFYVGFPLLLPLTISKSYQMIIGFLTGLLVDLFSNTPGIHAGACVFVIYIRNFWFFLIEIDSQEVSNINLHTVKGWSFIRAMLPLVFIHHIVVFTVENGGMKHFSILSTKILYSTAFSFIIIFIVNMLTTQRKYRV